MYMYLEESDDTQLQTTDRSRETLHSNHFNSGPYSPYTTHTKTLEGEYLLHACLHLCKRSVAHFPPTWSNIMTPKALPSFWNLQR